MDCNQTENIREQSPRGGRMDLSDFFGHLTGLATNQEGKRQSIKALSVT